MRRRFLAVLAGYFAMATVVMIALVPAFLWPGLAFHLDTMQVRPLWMAYSLVASAVAALVGGLLASTISRCRGSAIYLAVLVFSFGMFSAVAGRWDVRETSDASQPPRSFAERAANARQPTWYAFSLPILGALGTLAGSRIWAWRSSCEWSAEGLAGSAGPRH